MSVLLILKNNAFKMNLLSHIGVFILNDLHFT